MRYALVFALAASWTASAHGEEAEPGVRLAEEFARRARYRVEAGKAADNQARALERAGAHQQRQHRQQHQALERRLIELARMPRQRTGAGKHHGPGHVGRAAP